MVKMRHNMRIIILICLMENIKISLNVKLDFLDISFNFFVINKNTLDNSV